MVSDGFRLFPMVLDCFLMVFNGFRWFPMVSDLKMMNRFTNEQHFFSLNRISFPGTGLGLFPESGSRPGVYPISVCRKNLGILGKSISVCRKNRAIPAKPISVCRKNRGFLGGSKDIGFEVVLRGFGPKTSRCRRPARGARVTQGAPKSKILP